MPTYKERRSTRFTSGVSFVGTGRVRKDLVIPWTAFTAGSANTSASSDTARGGSLMDADTLSGSIPCLSFRNTGSACSVFAVAPFPLDADTSGSVTVFADWAYAKALASTAVLGACIYYLQGGSVITDLGTNAGSGLIAASAINSTASVITSSSICTLRSFSGSTTGLIAAKFWRDSTSGSDSSGSEFRFLNLRLRYTSNGFGPASTE